MKFLPHLLLCTMRSALSITQNHLAKAPISNECCLGQGGIMCGLLFQACCSFSDCIKDKWGGEHCKEGKIIKECPKCEDLCKKNGNVWCGDVCCLGSSCKDNECGLNSRVKLTVCSQATKWSNSISIYDLLSPSYLRHCSWLHLRCRMLSEILWNFELVSFHEYPHIVENFLIVSCQQGKCPSLHSCPSWSTCPVDEFAYIFGGIKTDNGVDSLDIETSSTEICRHKNLKFSRSEIVNDPLSCFLIFTSMIICACTLKSAFH